MGMKQGTEGPRPQRASESSVFTPHRVLLVAASTTALTLGAWALSVLVPSGPGSTGASIASLSPVHQPAAHDGPAPTVWLSALTDVTTGPFAGHNYTPEPVLPRVVGALPPLPARPTAPPTAATPQPGLPATAQPAPAVPPAPTVVEAPSIAAPTAVDVMALASLRAPRRSLIPVARPRVVSAPAIPAPAIATDEAAPLLALDRSRTPQPRPEIVTRLASLTITSDTAPLASEPRREPLSVQPLNEVIARSDRCETAMTRSIPRRGRRAGEGSAVIGQLASASGSARDNVIVQEVLEGNIPDFLRNLVPVTFTGQAANGQPIQVTICVMPDYLAVGSNADYVRVPLGLPAATRVAERFDMVLPTTRMVDVIYAQASVRLSPSPMDPTSQMASTNYFLRHNATVEGQRARTGGRLGQLVSGHKKDLVLTNRLERNPGRVAIYGWHRRSGSPIQPLSTVHGAQYADYSHGIRLISRHAFVNGRAIDLRELLSDSRLAGLVSSEGTISNRQLLASLR